MALLFMRHPTGFWRLVPDVLAAIDQAVQDGVDIFSLSIGQNSPPATTITEFFNPFNATLLAGCQSNVFVAEAAEMESLLQKHWYPIAHGNRKFLAGIGLSCELYIRNCLPMLRHRELVE
ncbi:hypothetical protein AB3S75_020791 [Citrus x aurantiifolia]